MPGRRNALRPGILAAGTGIGPHTVGRAGRGCCHHAAVPVMSQSRDINLIKNIPAARTPVTGVPRFRTCSGLGFVLIVMPQFLDGFCYLGSTIIALPVSGSSTVTGG